MDLPRVGGVAPKARIPLLYDATSRNQLILEKVQFDLRRKLGLNIELVGQDWKSLLRQLKTDPGPFFRFAWLAPFQDPITHLEVFRGGGRNNYTGWSNPRYDILLDEIATLPSGLARQKKIEEAQSILVDRECVIAPLFHYVQVFAVSRRVRGFVAKHNGAIDFSQVTLHSGHTGDTERAGQPGSQN